jgi:hypothetical protein
LKAFRRRLSFLKSQKRKRCSLPAAIADISSPGTHHLLGCAR